MDTSFDEAIAAAERDARLAQARLEKLRSSRVPAARAIKAGALSVLEWLADTRTGRVRELTRLELTNEARDASVPLRLRPRHAAGESLSGNDALVRARDVRKVDPLFTTLYDDGILVRAGALVVSLGQADMRAIVLHDRLFFILPSSAARQQAMRGQLETHLQELYTGESPPPFEFAALEALLMMMCADLTSRQSELAVKVQSALGELRHAMQTSHRALGYSKQFEAVREVKEAVREALVTAKVLEGCLARVIDNDEDLARMHLTALHSAEEEGAAAGGDGDGPPEPGRQTSTKRAMERLEDHEEAEMLLETYVQVVAAAIAALEVATYKIESTERFVELELDAARNRLLKVDVVASSAGAILGLGAFVGGVFGMNLPSPLFEGDPEEVGWRFQVVTASTALVMALAWLALFCWARPPPASSGAYR